MEELTQSEAEAYLRKIQSGEITASKHMKQLAEMMLPRFKDGYKRWHFDYKRANYPVEFIENFCCYPEGKLMGQPFVLEEYERAIIQIAFGFVDEDGVRQFQEVLVLFGRKNGKTSLGAALELYMLVADGEGAPQVYNVAASKSQAALAYGHARKMVLHSKKLKKRIRKGTVDEREDDGLIYDKNSGYITKLSSQTRNLDGLSSHMALLDEVAAYTNRDQYDLIKQSISSREQPMIWMITTNGFERDGIFDNRYDFACRLLSGEVQSDRFLPFLYELDDQSEWTDESCWIKANPGLGTVKKLETLRGFVSDAKQDSEFLPTVLTKDFNIPMNRAEAWLTFNEATCRTEFELEKGMFRYGIGGFDASDTTDLSSACMLMMRRGDDHIYAKHMYWLPEDALRDDGLRSERDNVPYRAWVSRGLLRLVPGNKVPKRVFIDWLDEMRSEFDVFTFAVGYDPWQMQGSDTDMLESYIGKSNTEKVIQGAKTLSDPMKQIRADYKINRLVDGGNPITEWCRMNVAIKRDINANIQPVKVQGKASKRIDGFMSELNAYIAMLRHYDDYLNII